VQYLKNILEQDHPAIKRRVRASQHFRSFWGAWRTIAGYEASHMIRKGRACCSVGSAAPLHARSVRGDELKCRSSTPTFGSTTKLQHILLFAEQMGIRYAMKQRIEASVISLAVHLIKVLIGQIAQPRHKGIAQ
jgi:hypothetical protein